MGRAPCCEKVGMKKGRWTSEEDEILRKYIEENGEGSWRSLPKKAGLKRCGKSCRLRWINYLRNDLKRGHISVDEEDLIIKLHSSLGNRWSVIAGQLPGRTDNEIKNYWNSHLSRRIHTFRRPIGEIPSYVMDLAKMGGNKGKKKGGKTSMMIKKKKNNNGRKNVQSKKVEGGGGDGGCGCDDAQSLSLPIMRNSPSSTLDQNEEVKSMVLDPHVERKECRSLPHEEVVLSDCDEEKKSGLTCNHNDEDTKENNMLGPYMGLEGDDFMGDGVLKSTLGEKRENGVAVVDSSKGYPSCSNGENGEWYYNSSSSTFTSSCFDEGWINWDDWDSILEGQYHRDDILPWLWEDSDSGYGDDRDQRMVEWSDEKKHKAIADWLLC